MFATLAMISAFGTTPHAYVRPHVPAGTKTYQGSFSDGATYLIQVPSNYNGTFVLYSHGYVAPGSGNPAVDAPDSTSAGYLLAQGYAIGGSSYASTGWAVQQALPDQVATLSTFVGIAGQPSRTIAWGDSLGGMITAGLIQQYPSLFSGAVPMCGVVGGGVGIWNIALDGAFVFNTLVAGNSLQVVDISNPSSNYSDALTTLATAQYSPQGQARIALTAAVADTPDWFETGYPPPASSDYTSQEGNQFLWFYYVDFVFDFYLRAELEARAGGNPSFNTGVNYRKQLAKSVNKAEVEALYSQAGLSLDADLKTLENAPRISADAGALNYLSDNIIYNGQIGVPVLTMHTIGDGLVGNQNESAYEDVVRSAHDQQLLRETFVYRAGHCAFTPGEEIAGFQALIDRLNTGKWKNLTPAALNSYAAGLGSSFNPYTPAFQAYKPAPYLRTYDGTPP
jgi:pimeloyl-ACP methyl ester carboxylesterase